MGNYNCSQQEDNVEYTENFTGISLNQLTLQK